jgi:hypothetical protein
MDNSGNGERPPATATAQRQRKRIFRQISSPAPTEIAQPLLSSVLLSGPDGTPGRLPVSRQSSAAHTANSISRQSSTSDRMPGDPVSALVGASFNHHPTAVHSTAAHSTAASFNLHLTAAHSTAHVPVPSKLSEENSSIPLPTRSTAIASRPGLWPQSPQSMLSAVLEKQLVKESPVSNEEDGDERLKSLLDSVQPKEALALQQETMSIGNSKNLEHSEGNFCFSSF